MCVFNYSKCIFSHCLLITFLLCKVLQDTGDCLFGAKTPKPSLLKKSSCKALSVIDPNNCDMRHVFQGLSQINAFFFSSSSKSSTVCVTRPWNSFFLTQATVGVILLSLLSTCRSDPRAKPVSEPGNIWAGFWRARVGKAGRLPAARHWHISLFAACVSNCVSVWLSNGVCCLYTCLLNKLLLSLLALVDSPVCLPAICFCRTCLLCIGSILFPRNIGFSFLIRNCIFTVYVQQHVIMEYRLWRNEVEHLLDSTWVFFKSPSNI